MMQKRRFPEAVRVVLGDDCFLDKGLNYRMDFDPFSAGKEKFRPFFQRNVLDMNNRHTLFPEDGKEFLGVKTGGYDPLKRHLSPWKIIVLNVNEQQCGFHISGPPFQIDDCRAPA